MTIAPERHTVLPPDGEESAVVKALKDLLAASDAPPRLIGPDGTEITVPPAVHHVLVDVVNLLDRGLAVTVDSHNTLLTTQEAADILNVSRPTLVRLLTEDEIPHEYRGKHRRVLLADVLAYKERARVRRRKVLDEMLREAHESGDLDRTDVFIRTR
ncbi:helix-turn-helix domain-containing protein [Actinocrispum wychmicini]|uniref:Excisionase family DNA binding protein n=1 Tax=Actinocrispum wychmicini TaxID=1213861 RepID=A0A4R2JXM0_9PSEU|nr:helix-turn-helix domain-containing protein [Actinocrispum wychmicini]TCO64624.1 excisionase family DNA binding protein [Actinocrispum wychmicini]